MGKERSKFKRLWGLLSAAKAIQWHGCIWSSSCINGSYWIHGYNLVMRDTVSFNELNDSLAELLEVMEDMLIDMQSLDEEAFNDMSKFASGGVPEENGFTSIWFAGDNLHVTLSVTNSKEYVFITARDGFDISTLFWATMNYSGKCHIYAGKQVESIPTDTMSQIYEYIKRLIEVV